MMLRVNDLSLNRRKYLVEISSHRSMTDYEFESFPATIYDEEEEDFYFGSPGYSTMSECVDVRFVDILNKVKSKGI